ncbi:MAG: 4-hydroxy-tetrahydrodipicolinate synthase [Armatimonadota bacterium]
MFKGVGTAIVTPFNEDKTIDYASFEKLIARQVQAGVDFLVVLGTTGEAATVSEDEKIALIEKAIASANKKIKIVAGIGSNNTKSVLEFMKKIDSMDIDGYLSVTPYYNKPTQEGLYLHFAEQAKVTKKEIILYNVPGRTGCNLLPATVKRLAEDYKNITAVKEASGDLNQVAEIIKNKGTGFTVLSGDDALTLPMISLGGNGVISVVSNEVPSEFSDMVHYALDKDFVSAAKIHHKLLDLMNINFIESNPIPVKCALSLMGLIKEEYRLPLCPCKPESKDKIKKVLLDLSVEAKI